MKLTIKELIRLKKETHLLEHGFYDEEIEKWFDFKYDQKTNQKIIVDKNGLKHIFSNPALFGSCSKIIKQFWFKEKFPEFFKEGK